MQKHVVYVPAHVVPQARDLAIDLTGGATLSPGHQGYWRDAEGNLVEDDITLVTVFEPASTARDRIVAALFAAGEQAVAFETGGTPYLVNRPMES